MRVRLSRLRRQGGEEPSAFCLIDTFRIEALNPKVSLVVFLDSFFFFLYKPANKRQSVLSITIYAYKSILYPSLYLSLLRATIVFLLPLLKWMLFTLKKRQKKRHALKKPRRRFNCFASPPWLQNPRLWNVNSSACGRWELWRQRRKPMLDCPL